MLILYTFCIFSFHYLSGYIFSLSEIQLGDNKLEDICHEVFQLQSLVTLNLSNNNLKYLLKTLHSQYPVVTSQTTGNNINSTHFNAPDLHFNNKCLFSNAPD